MRLRREFRDTIELLLLPFLSVLLPWSWCYAMYKWICKTGLVYDERAQDALEEAQKYTPIDDMEQWLQHRRLTTLLDHADHYLSRFRSERWIKQYTSVLGNWPQAHGPQLFLTFHWGAGMLALNHLNQHGKTAHMLVHGADPQHFRGRWVQYQYIRHRIQRISDLLLFPTIDTHKNTRGVVAAFQKQETIIAVIDVPESAQTGLPVDLLGHIAHVPRALLRMAAERLIPVTVYVTGIDYITGTRTLAIHTLEPANTPEELAKAVFAHLSAAITDKPASWHLWTECGRFFGI